MGWEVFWMLHILNYRKRNHIDSWIYLIHCPKKAVTCFSLNENCGIWKF